MSKVLFITSCCEGWGGSEELWAGAAERLKKAGFEIQSLRSTPAVRAQDGGERLARAGIPMQQFALTLPIRLRLALVRTLHAIFPWLRSRFQYVPFTSLLRSFNADLAVISQGYNYDGILGVVNVAAACERAGVPYVLICQKAYDELWPPDALRPVVQRAFSLARRIFFVAEHNRRLTQWQLNLPLPHSELIFNPYMIRTDQPLPWPPVREGVLRLACVARLDPRDKGQDLLLLVLAREEWRQRSIEVNFFGAGDTARGLEEMAQRLQLTNVRFCGHTTDVTQIWKEHHALILPSRYEGLPLVLVEAMHCGRFGIVTNAGGMAEVTDDGVTAFVALGATVEALAEAMERAWERRQDWEQIGLAAAREIRQIVPEDPCGVLAEKLTAIHDETVGKLPPVAGQPIPEAVVNQAAD